MRLITLSLIAAALAAAACTDSVGPELRQPAKLEIVNGQGQVGTAGSRLEAPVSVRLVDERGRPVAGQPVSFVVTAGDGSVSPATDVTDRRGVARTWWTMGPAAATAQAVEARVAAGSIVLTTTFTAVVTPGAAARLVRYPVPDDSSIVSGIGTLLKDSLAVQVLDAFGNPLPGVEVVWTTPDEGGTVASPTTTDSLGVARTTWRLGSGTHQLAFGSVSGVGELLFVARAATKLSWTCPGDCWVLEVGSRVRIGVAPQFGSSSGPPVTLAFEVAPGSGTVTPTVSTSGTGSVTIDSIAAWVEWTLGDAPGPQKLTARLGGLQGEYVIDVVPRLVPVAQVPGTVLDATSDRVLWAGGGRLQIRTIATGEDVTVPGGVPDGGAVLFDGGALLWYALDRSIFEYRNGELTSLGSYTADSPPSVEGNWAAWGVGGAPNGSKINRRDLVGGTNLIISNPHFHPIPYAVGRNPDVGPHGEVVFIVGEYPSLILNTFYPADVVLYRGGSFSVSRLNNVQAARTDGVNVALTILNTGYRGIPPSTSLCLQTSLDFTCPARGAWDAVYSYELAGGWFAYSSNTFAGPELRRSPAGVTTPMPGCWDIRALAPDGTLVCDYARRYRVIRPDGTGYDAGLWNGGRVVWRGDRFLVIRGGSVYALAPR